MDGGIHLLADEVVIRIGRDEPVLAIGEDDAVDVGVTHVDGQVDEGRQHALRDVGDDHLTGGVSNRLEARQDGLRAGLVENSLHEAGLTSHAVVVGALRP